MPSIACLLERGDRLGAIQRCITVLGRLEATEGDHYASARRWYWAWLLVLLNA